MELKELEKMKVDQLRAEATKLEGVQGISSMKKQELIDLLCEKLEIQRPEAQSEEKPEEIPTATADAGPKEKARAEGEAEAKPADTKETKPKPKVAEKKGSVFKVRLKALQAKRKQALADRDYQALADLRMRIKKYKRKIKKESAAASSS